MFSFRDGTSAEGLAVNLTTTAGRVLLEGTVNGNYVTAIADGLTWAANSWLNIAGTKSAADGLIIYVNGTAAVNTTANAKAAFSSAITGCNLNSRNSNLDQSAIGIGVYAGFKIWDTALSDAELSALSVGSFGVPVAGEIASVSALTGAPSIGKTLAGAIASVSVLTGADKLQRQMLGDMQSVSEISGDAFLVQQLEGEIESQSELQGAAFLDMHLAGTLPAVSQLTGQITGAANVPPGYLKASIRVYPV